MSKPGDSVHPQSFWLWVMCLSGVDYFSTLGYQPSIAAEAAGRLGPYATLMLVLVTLFGALPVYAYVAGKSPYGQGSIYMLEQLLRGWAGKTLVLVMLGFAATDFIITKTLSAADATEHLISNPYWPLGHSVNHTTQAVVVTMFLLLLLGATFLRGFKEVIGIAVALVAVYLVLNALVVGSGLVYLFQHPEKLAEWHRQVMAGDWHIHGEDHRGHRGLLAALLVAAILFPKLALGLSGFETGVAVMPLVRGGHAPGEELAGRIRNTRKLLLTAALIMSVYLIGSSLVVSTLIDPAEMGKTVGPDGQMVKGPANARALAYLAHGEGAIELNPLFGGAFGTLYDLSTIAILWFAGASAMAGLLNLVPLYLPRYGMAPQWARTIPPLVILFTAINLFVTFIFKADVDAQGGAYATGVLMLISSAAVAAVIGSWKERSGPWYRRLSWYYLFTVVVFAYTTAFNIAEKPEGIHIAGIFIGVLLVTSVVTRFLRSSELRFERFRFTDPDSEREWQQLQTLGFHILVPHKPTGATDRAHKEAAIRLDHRLTDDIPIVFLEVYLEDASDFYQEPVMKVWREGDLHIVEIRHCSSVAHALAAVGLELSKGEQTLPPEFHFDWSQASSVRAVIGFLLFGEGNVPALVQDLLRKAEPNVERRPRVIVG
ncbi:MAG: amino acid transporter [Planctomycetia bacterium]|nr:amino acid transporter [Planctomycetia bacterium]